LEAEVPVDQIEQTDIDRIISIFDFLFDGIDEI